MEFNSKNNYIPTSLFLLKLSLVSYVDMRPWVYDRPPKCRPLPQDCNIDGRPVWEPPILNYSYLIGEEYEQKREAVLKYCDGNVVRTTEILDTQEEYELLNTYRVWCQSEYDFCSYQRPYGWRLPTGKKRYDTGPVVDFFSQLSRQIDVDIREVNANHDLDHIRLDKMEDGTYTVVNTAPARGKARIDPEERLRHIEIMRHNEATGAREALHWARDITGAFNAVAKQYPQYRHLAHLRSCERCHTAHVATVSERKAYLPFEYVCGYQYAEPPAAKTSDEARQQEENEESETRSEDFPAIQTLDEPSLPVEATPPENAANVAALQHPHGTNPQKGIPNQDADSSVVVPLPSAEESTQLATNEPPKREPAEAVNIALDLLSLW